MNNPDNVFNLPNVISLDEHIKLIAEAWKRTNLDYIGGIIKTGKEIIAAQDQHGDSFRAMAKKLPFSWQTAGKLTVIAKWSVSPEIHPQLPAAWTILHQLALLPERLMLQALDDGRIHPNMSRKDATDLRPKKRKNKKLKSPQQPVVTKAVEPQLDVGREAYAMAILKQYPIKGNAKKKREDNVARMVEVKKLLERLGLANFSAMPSHKVTITDSTGRKREVWEPHPDQKIISEILTAGKKKITLKI